MQTLTQLIESIRAGSTKHGGRAPDYISAPPHQVRVWAREAAALAPLRPAEDRPPSIMGVPLREAPNTEAVALVWEWG